VLSQAAYAAMLAQLQRSSLMPVAGTSFKEAIARQDRLRDKVPAPSPAPVTLAPYLHLGCLSLARGDA